MSALSPQDCSATGGAHQNHELTSHDSSVTPQLPWTFRGESPSAAERDRVETNQRRILEQSHEAVFLIDCATRRILQCNAAFCRLLGYSAAEALQLDIYAVGAVRRKVIDQAIELVELNSAAHLGPGKMRRKNGTVLEVDISATTVELDRGTALAVTAEDISERKNAELEHHRLREEVMGTAVEWRETFDAIGSPILVVDPALRILRLNAAASRMLCTETNQALRTLLSAYPGEVWQSCAQTVETALRTRKMTQGRSSDPQGRQFEIKVAPAINNTAIVLLVDVSELHALQLSLRESETLSAMGSLVAGVAHEVRNPLFSISATLDAFQGRFAFSAEQWEYVKILRGELDRLNLLMRDLLTYGRAQALELTSCDFAQLMSSAIELNRAQAAAKDVQIRCLPHPRLRRIDMDGQRIITVLRNILENAIQHAPAATSVEIETTAVSGELRCSVRDHGQGFSEEALRRGLEPFFSKRHGGTGLGLSIVQRIVHEHGGAVVLQNHPRGGAIVLLRFPCSGPS